MLPPPLSHLPQMLLALYSCCRFLKQMIIFSMYFCIFLAAFLLRPGPLDAQIQHGGCSRKEQLLETNLFSSKISEGRNISEAAVKLLISGLYVEQKIPAATIEPRMQASTTSKEPLTVEITDTELTGTTTTTKDKKPVNTSQLVELVELSNYSTSENITLEEHTTVASVMHHADFTRTVTQKEGSEPTTGTVTLKEGSEPATGTVGPDYSTTKPNRTCSDQSQIDCYLQQLNNTQDYVSIPSLLNCYMHGDN